jgi:hypothetical protein
LDDAPLRRWQQSMEAIMTVKIVNLLFAVLLFLAAIVQYNDPDSLPWIGVYLLSAIACLGAALGWGLRPLAAAMLVVCLVWGLYLVPAVPQWLANHPVSYIFDDASTTVDYMEGSRESLGLLFAAAMLVISLIYRPSRT